MKRTKLALLAVVVLAAAASAFTTSSPKAKFVSRHYHITGTSGSNFTVELFDDANKKCSLDATPNCGLYYDSQNQVSLVPNTTPIDQTGNYVDQ